MRYTFKTYQHKDGNRRYRYYKIIYGKSGGLEEKAKKKALRNVNIIFCVCAPACMCYRAVKWYKTWKKSFY